MNEDNQFRFPIGKTIFENKYKHENAETWEELSKTLIDDVCKDRDKYLLGKEDHEELKEIHSKMKFIAGGRYLYYAGRGNKFFNNCFLLKAEVDNREDWADLSWKSESCLMTGGGIGIDYSVYRPKGSIIRRTGGEASGAISKMEMINEIGRRVMQGGSRRSAIYASLNWLHGDIEEFLKVKDWDKQYIHGAYDLNGKQLSVGDLKKYDFNYHAPLDMTNVSVNYDNKFLKEVWGSLKNVGKDEINYLPKTFLENCRYALQNGEPGFSFNFFDKERETLRNACTEVSSEDDSDVCNLGSINIANISDKKEFKKVVRLASKFLLCGTLKADLPYQKIYGIREKNRRLGLGLMGIHEWLLQRGYRYEVTDELKEWLEIYEKESKKAADELADELGISKPVAYRAIAPTGSISMISGTSSGLEPLFAVAYKRRYLKNGNDWHYQYVVDGAAKNLIQEYGLDPEKIDSAIDLAENYEQRIKFQADIQDYVDMGISSTINLPAWGTQYNNESRVDEFAKILAKYAHRLRGFTCYPDGARGGQPLTPVNYYEAIDKEKQEFKEEYVDICDITGGGTCGI